MDFGAAGEEEMASEEWSVEPDRDDSVGYDSWILNWFYENVCTGQEVEVDLHSGDLGRVHRVREVTEEAGVGAGVGAGARVAAAAVQKVRTKSVAW